MSCKQSEFKSVSSPFFRFLCFRQICFPPRHLGHVSVSKPRVSDLVHGNSSQSCRARHFAHSRDASLRRLVCTQKHAAQRAHARCVP